MARRGLLRMGGYSCADARLEEQQQVHGADTTDAVERVGYSI